MKYTEYLNYIKLGVIPEKQVDQAKIFGTHSTTIHGWHKKKIIPYHVDIVINLMLEKIELEKQNKLLTEKIYSYRIVINDLQN